MYVKVVTERTYKVELNFSEKEAKVISSMIQNPGMNVPADWRTFCELLFKQLNPPIGVPASDP